MYVILLKDHNRDGLFLDGSEELARQVAAAFGDELDRVIPLAEFDDSIPTSIIQDPYRVIAVRIVRFLMPGATADAQIARLREIAPQVGINESIQLVQSARARLAAAAES